MKSLKHVMLHEVLELADSGTWGSEAVPGEPGEGNPVLRSSNIQDYRLFLDEVAWRRIPAKDTHGKRLNTGDIIVTKSSGSSEHIGKCCIFSDPGSGGDYYFSN